MADYVFAAIVGVVLSAVGGIAMGFIGGFWLLAIFAGPIGGGIVAEGIRTATKKHRGRYLWLIACGAIVVGGLAGLVGLAWLPLLATILTGNIPLLSRFGLGLLFNLGFWIYLALAVSTAYARLRV